MTQQKRVYDLDFKRRAPSPAPAQPKFAHTVYYQPSVKTKSEPLPPARAAMSTADDKIPAPTTSATNLSPPVKKKSKRRALAIGFAIVLVAIFGFKLISGELRNRNGSSVSAQTLTDTAADEVNGQIAQNAPSKLKISKLSLDSAIIKQDISLQNLAAPSKSNQIGWVASSATVDSQDGAIVLTGHTSNGSAKGPFFDLDKLQIGDVIEIEQGSGAITSYEVIATRAYLPNEIDTGKVSKSFGAGRGLNLVSFPGKAGEQVSLVVFALAVD